ncbi:hypothetical protein T492DRAFT_950895 [Pavlovales sp. CCMP2436]|nr:hypothetical protein T492DRAFT_950895 [Pavlovales sp. CCMP2436]
MAAGPLPEATGLSPGPSPGPSPGLSPGLTAAASPAGGQHASPTGVPPPLPAEPADLGEPNYPRCAHCKRLARPAILMFEDESCVEAESRAYDAWEMRVCAGLRKDPMKRLVILEGGCGLRVPTVRRNSERLLKKLAPYGAKLVRVNLDFAESRPSLTQHTISVRSRVLSALETIDRAIGIRLAQGAARSVGKARGRQLQSA